MIRKLIFSLIVLTLALGTVAPVQAQDTNLWTFFQNQNVDDARGDLSMQAFEKQGGSQDFGSATFSFDPGAALAFHPGLSPTYPSGDRIGFSSALPAGYEASVVISSNVEVVAVAQIGNNASGTVGNPAGTASAFYQGIGSSSRSKEVNFPLVKNNFNGQTTTFYIQAAGTAASATITYVMNNGQQYQETKSIDANRMTIFRPAAAGVPGSNCGVAPTSPCLGAATVQSTTGDIVGVVLEHPSSGTPWPFALSTRGLTDADKGTKLLAPIIKHDFNGSKTGFSVQNTGNGQATVEISLRVTNVCGSTPSSIIGQTYTQEVSIPQGGATVFSQDRNNLGGMPPCTFASATITSKTGQALVGTVNESKDQGATPGGKAKAVYAAFNASGSGISSSLAAPLVKERFGNVEGTTGLVVANAGTQATKFEAEYTDEKGTTRVLRTVNDVQPGEAVSFFQVFQNIGNKFTPVSGFTNFNDFFNTKNAVIVKSTNGQNIVAVAQESDRRDAKLDIKNYEGFNLQ